jgi:hypothetical protein
MSYRERGFWSRDFQAEVYLYLLSDEVADVADRPAWLDAARIDWQSQATTGHMGCVSSCLDAHLGVDPDRVATVLILSQRVRQRLAHWAPAIPKHVVNAFGTGGEEESFNSDLDTTLLLKFADAFIKLLCGEIPAEPGRSTVY